MLNQGNVAIDGLSGEGGSSLATTLLLNNTGVLTLGNSGLSSADSVSAASLNNSGRISLTGSGSAQALMKIGSAAGTSGAGKLTGTVYLGYDSAIQFASGSITTIASGASLDLAAGNAYMEVGASNSNSALTGLTSVLGKLLLDNGAAVSLASLNVTGAMFVDSIGGDGGSTAKISGGLTNSGTLNIGNSNLQGSGASVSAATLANSGVIDLTGGNGHNASLAVSGTTTNNGAVYLISIASSLAGAVSGTGTFDLFNNSTLGFGSSVSSGQTVTFDGAGALSLGQAGQFAGTIAGGHASDDRPHQPALAVGCDPQLRPQRWRNRRHAGGDKQWADREPAVERRLYEQQLQHRRRQHAYRRWHVDHLRLIGVAEALWGLRAHRQTRC